ncbi:FemAB family XrtA/PEP-CTERM system-associated protein [Rhodopila sp.]|jgi:FemAB-related protein (PEP-CTERM system-associated)|uniref:FemAB family XrtA/PEP-CTERM system-associated protein n=1 Tax=Rhodopila sp. TaxID=2480087 RepID=UPI002CF4A2EA|nr:FemAB family XrtA/PEP-CTERM system-associated protein [Rhodopila sp.]HVZ08615.1 FemAB family XrtA/PEP-CTERM system-associated protein [Rhodopila sp.]
MSVTIRRLEDGSRAAWDRFVEATPAATFFHRTGWADAVQRAFGHTPHYIFAERDGAVTGVLPLIRVRTRLFGDTLISNAFCVYGGVAAVDDDSAAALVAEAEALRESLGVSAVELRDREPVTEAARGRGWIERPDLYVTFRKPIDADNEKNMKAIPRKQRAMVRKAISLGLTSVVGTDAGALYPVYAESVRNLGTPVFSRRWFDTLMAVFGEDADIVTILNKDRPVASVMNFYFRDEVLPYYGGGTSEARACAANDFMYWEVMRRAADRGYRVFDFGRSKIDTGAFAFKHNWGFPDARLHYRFKLAPGQGIPDHNPANPKYRLFIKGWKKLPLPVANAVGPFIVRGLG